MWRVASVEAAGMADADLAPSRDPLVMLSAQLEGYAESV
jgi:hypothetical protein